MRLKQLPIGDASSSVFGRRIVGQAAKSAVFASRSGITDQESRTTCESGWESPSLPRKVRAERDLVSGLPDRSSPATAESFSFSLRLALSGTEQFSASFCLSNCGSCSCSLAAKPTMFVRQALTVPSGGVSNLSRRRMEARNHHRMGTTTRVPRKRCPIRHACAFAAEITPRPRRAAASSHLPGPVLRSAAERYRNDPFPYGSCRVPASWR